MEIKKEYNDIGKCYDFEFIKGNKHLQIFFGGNLDLYMTLGNNKVLPYGENTSIDFDVTKEDYEIYQLFDILYNNIINSNIFDDDEMNKKIENSYIYQNLVDETKNITWVSDEGPEKLEDRLTISKLDEDRYKLIFERKGKEDWHYFEYGLNNPFDISIRFRNSGSRYAPFNIIFMKMFHKLQELDIDYHQYHIEEYMYTKKLKK